MKKKLLATALLSSAILVSCGGGGGSNDTQSTITPGGGGGSNDTQSTVTPSTTLQGTYTGAVRAGDFATYSVNGNTLSYNIQGVYFNQQGSVSIKPWLSNDSNTHFWQTSDGNTKLFLSQNLGLAYLPDLEDINGREKEAYILGLKDINNISSILGKTFVYIDISNGGLDGCEVTINDDGDGSYGTYSASCIDEDTTIKGCWKLDTNNNRLLAKDYITDCANWDYNGKPADYYVIAKPGDNRAGFIVDHTDGSGVGIGLEKKKYNLQNELDKTTTTKFEALYVEYDGTTCKATIDVWYDNASNQWKYRWTSDDSCEESVSGTLEENCLYDYNGNKQTYDGVLCAEDSSGDKSNIMFDVQDGYYIAIANDLSYMEIGAKK